MYDGTCSISLLPYNYPKKLEEYGIKCKIFNPIKPALSTVQNNRDHRKIVVIDGKTAFTGGVNLADEVYRRTGAVRNLERYRNHDPGRGGKKLHADVPGNLECG